MNPADLPEGPRVSRKAAELAALTPEEHAWMEAFYQRSEANLETPEDLEIWDKLNQRQRDARREWTKKIRYDLAMGRMTQEEADALGYLGNSSDVWKPLPDTLYHVTTAKSEVYASGELRTRSELGQRSGGRSRGW